MTNLFKLISDSAINIDRISSVLHDHNIPNIIKNHNTSGAIAGFGTIPDSVELLINKSDLSRAEKVLKEIDH